MLIAEVLDEINESDFPYLADLQYYETIKNRELCEHIDRVGNIIYDSER